MEITKDRIKEMKIFTKKLNILIIDDDRTALTQVEIMCKELFNMIVLADDGLEGILKYNKFLKENNKTFDLILTDINMPEMNGLELSAKIKEINPSQEILIMSAYNDSSLLQKIINSGINNYVHKPIQFEEFLTSIFKLTHKILSNVETENKKNETLNLNKELTSRMRGYNSLSLSSSVDENGIITFISDKLLEITGYKKEDLLGKDHRILIHPDYQSESFDKLWKTIKSGNIWRGRIQKIRKNKKSFWTNTTIGPYFDEFDKIIGYYFIHEDITAQINTNELYDKINLLLNNVNEGFLLFNKDFKINRGYSLKCISIFNNEIIEDRDISELLFSNKKDKELFRKIIFDINESSNELEIELYLSLIPKESLLNNKYIEINCKLLDNKVYMLILKDISKRKKLEKELRTKDLYQKMVISIVSNSNNFVDIKNGFEGLINSIYEESKDIMFIPHNVVHLKRVLHTYKGLLSQINFVFTPDTIHKLESKIDETLGLNNGILKIDESENIFLSFKKDLEIISNMLGENYILEQEKLHDNSKILTKIKDDILNIVIDPKHINFKLQNIASKIESMTYLNLYNLLSKYIPVLEDLSCLVNKPMNTFVINGDKNLKIPPTFINLYRNLIHLLRNSIDHGIENEKIREERNKDLNGNIRCDFKYESGFLILNISDDGNGIDFKKIEQKAIEKDIYKEEDRNKISENDLLLLIFEDEFTTKEEITSISGRGIGNGSFKHELDLLEGSIDIINEIGKGLTYIMKIPMQNIVSNDFSNNLLEDCIDVADIVVEKTKSFLVNDLKLNIIDSRYCNNTDFDNKVNSFIKFSSNQNFVFCFSCSDLILKTFFDLLPLADNDFDEYKEEVSSEFINTIIGLSIQNLPTVSKVGTLDIPYTLSAEETYDKHYNKHYKIIQNIIQTNLGNINCSLLVESKL